MAGSRPVLTSPRVVQMGSRSVEEREFRHGGIPSPIRPSCRYCSAEHMDTWVPIRFEAVQATGKTKPLLLDCARLVGNGESRRRLLVKAVGMPHVTDGAVCNEWLGGQIARAYGLHAPETCLVDLSKDFLDDVQDELARHELAPQPGVAVGIEFISNMTMFPRPATLHHEEEQEAADILVFDLLVQNPDRRPDNPNCGRARGQVVPFDHEHAFSFRQDGILLPPAAWEVSALPFSRRHLFTDALSDYDDWIGAARALLARGTSGAIERCSGVPPEWASAGSQVKQHLEAVMANQDEFGRHVAQSQGRLL